ncbi:MAG TPA: hypothetical protein DER58_00040 [Firmicutes bacterium]|jgi:GntR family transcriptional regulator|nr:hypothetical protein [Bacillota bacterium]
MQQIEPVGDGRSVPERAYEKLLAYVVEGKFAEGKLPPEMDLSKQLGVSRTALREALLRLESQGYISRRRRVGTVVVANRPKVEGGLEKLNSATGIIRNAGMEPGTTFKSWRMEEANPLVAQQLGVESGTKVSVFERVRTADGIPFCFDISFILEKHFGEADANKMGESLFEYFSEQEKLRIRRAVSRIYPYVADSLTGDRLALPKGHLLTLLEQTHYTASGEALWYSRAFYRSDLIGFHIVRVP